MKTDHCYTEAALYMPPGALRRAVQVRAYGEEPPLHPLEKRMYALLDAYRRRPTPARLRAMRNRVSHIVDDFAEANATGWER